MPIVHHLVDNELVTYNPLGGGYPRWTVSIHSLISLPPFPPVSPPSEFVLLYYYCYYILISHLHPLCNRASSLQMVPVSLLRLFVCLSVWTKHDLVRRSFFSYGIRYPNYTYRLVQ